ncbi:MAG TPA: VWA domain-containing protein [Pyrinomonadaceae bacterium]|nr:VWA domain-containing protein [Pyrinomonadaceae bacterium]
MFTDHAPLRPRLLVCSALIVCFVFAADVCLGQQPTNDDVVRIDTNLVVLDALVIDKKTGHPVRDLKTTDFELFVDDVKQQITYFSEDQLPLSVVLLLDVSGSVVPFIEEIGRNARAALEKLKPQDEVAVMAFAIESTLVQDFTKDRQLVSDKIVEASRVDTIGRGTFFNDALRSAVSVMEKASNPVSRRVILVVSDNIASERGSNKHLVVDLLESGIVVYGLVVRGGIGKFINMMTVGAMHGLDDYTEATGGELIGAKKKEVDDRLAELINHLRARYSMGFKPPETTLDGKLHRIKLKMSPSTLTRNGKLTVRTRNGYYLRRP